MQIYKGGERTPERHHARETLFVTPLDSLSSVYQFCDAMRNAVVVFLWGVAAASLLSLSPVQAEEEAEISSSTEASLVGVRKDQESVEKDQGNSTIFLDPFPESNVAPNFDLLPQDDVVLHTDTILDDEYEEEVDEHVDEEGEWEESLLERNIGNVISERGDGQKTKYSNSQNLKKHNNKGLVKRGNSKNPKGLKRRKKVDARAKGQQGNRRRPEDGKLKSRKKEKKTKAGQKMIRKVVKSKDGALPSKKNEESSPKNDSRRQKREIQF